MKANSLKRKARTLFGFMWSVVPQLLFTVIRCRQRERNWDLQDRDFLFAALLQSILIGNSFGHDYHEVKIWYLTVLIGGFCFCFCWFKTCKLMCVLQLSSSFLALFPLFTTFRRGRNNLTSVWMSVSVSTGEQIGCRAEWARERWLHKDKPTMPRCGACVIR